VSIKTETPFWLKGVFGFIFYGFVLKYLDGGVPLNEAGVRALASKSPTVVMFTPTWFISYEYSFDGERLSICDIWLSVMLLSVVQSAYFWPLAESETVYVITFDIGCF